MSVDEANPFLIYNIYYYRDLMTLTMRITTASATTAGTESKQEKQQKSIVSFSGIVWVAELR